MKKLLFILSCIWGLRANSYNIDNHKQLSALSFELLDFCQLDFNLDPQELINFSGLEDSSPHHASFFTRLANWHFYTDSKKEDQWIIAKLIRRDFWKRWNNLMEEYQLNSTDKKERSALAGAIVHYIQDVSNPAHIAPVYHGPGLKDKFDSFPILSQALRENFPSLCKQMSYSENSAFEILEKTASSSKQSMHKSFTYKKNGIRHTESFGNAFWHPKESGDFFGVYGNLGNNFGNTEFEHPKWFHHQNIGPKNTIQRDTAFYEVSESSFHNFALERQSSAILSTAKLILLMTSK